MKSDSSLRNTREEEGGGGGNRGITGIGRGKKKVRHTMTGLMGSFRPLKTASALRGEKEGGQGESE